MSQSSVGSILYGSGVDALPVLAAFGGVALLVLVIGGTLSVRSERARIVTANSAALCELARLNSTMALGPAHRQVIRYGFDNTCKSKATFDRFDLQRFFITCLAERESEIRPQIQVRVDALSAWDRYSAAVETARTAYLGQSRVENLAEENFNRIEARLYLKRTIKQPVPTALITIQATYTSPKGQNSYRKSITANFGQLVAGMQQMAAERERQSTTAFLRAQERSKMTTALRYEILKRDNYRCKSCGTGANHGVQLHVDHINPVSKGGLTVRSNLQTLCQDCNLGKSNRH